MSSDAETRRPRVDRACPRARRPRPAGRPRRARRAVPHPLRPDLQLPPRQRRQPARRRGPHDADVPEDARDDRRFRWQSAPFSAWLFRIAHNLAMDHFRARRRWQPEEEVPEPPGEEEPSAELEAMQTIGRESMLKLIEQLSPEQQQVLTLKFVFNFPNAEVAAILDKTEGAIKSLQHRALASLQKQIAAGTELACARGARGRDRRAAELGEDDALPRAHACARRAARQGACRHGADRGPAARALAETVGARKVTPAAIRVVDVPGTGPALLGNLRQVDALLVVLDGFSGTRVPADDLETLKLELLVADRDHVERRLERVAKQAKSGDAKLAGGGERARAAARAPRRRADARRLGRGAAARARAAHDEAADRDRERRRAASTCSSRPSSRSCPTRRRRSSAAAASPRSARSCAGSRRRST